MKIAQKRFFSFAFILLGSIVLAISFIRVASGPFFKKSISDRQATAWQEHNALREVDLFPFDF